MTKNQAKELKAGRPGTKVFVRATVRTLSSSGEMVEVQFPGHSLWIPIEDIEPQ